MKRFQIFVFVLALGGLTAGEGYGVDLEHVHPEPAITPRPHPQMVDPFPEAPEEPVTPTVVPVVVPDAEQAEGVVVEPVMDPTPEPTPTPRPAPTPIFTPDPNEVVEPVTDPEPEVQPDPDWDIRTEPAPVITPAEE